MVFPREVAISDASLSDRAEQSVVSSQHFSAHSASSKASSPGHIPRLQWLWSRVNKPSTDAAIQVSRPTCPSLSKQPGHCAHLAVQWALGAFSVFLLLVLFASVQAHKDFSAVAASSPITASMIVSSQNQSSGPAGSNHLQVTIDQNRAQLALSSLPEPAKQKRAASGLPMVQWNRFVKRMPVKSTTDQLRQPLLAKARLSSRKSVPTSGEEDNGSTIMNAIRKMRKIGDWSSLINLINNDNEQIDERQVAALSDSLDSDEMSGEPLVARYALPLMADQTSDDRPPTGALSSDLKGKWQDFVSKREAKRNRGWKRTPSRQVNAEWTSPDWSLVPLASLYRNALLTNVTQAANEPLHLSSSNEGRANPSETRPGNSINNSPDANDSDFDDYEHWNNANGLLIAKQAGEPFRNVMTKRRLVINSSNGARLYVDPARGIDFPSEEEAEARGIVRPDAHPRRPARPHPKLTPAPTARPYQRMMAASTIRPERALWNATNEGGNRFGDSYYDKQHRAASGHRYYQASRPSTTTAKPDSRGKSGEEQNERSNNRRGLNKWNRNQMANLYKTNRTAWEIEFKKQQEFAAEARRKGHVYGFVVNRGHRAAGGKKLYDVPQVECPSTENGIDRFSCPTPDMYGRFLCIDDQHICNGYTDCPKGEDEDSMSCMFYRSTKAHLDVLADYLLQWARGRHF